MSDKIEHKYVSLASLVDRPVSHMEAIVPAENNSFLEDINKQIPLRITKIQGISSDWYTSKGEKKAVYPNDAYFVVPGDMYIGIRVVGMDECDCEYDYTVRISDEPNCCEEWGAMLSEDDLSRFIGAQLLDIYFTDTALHNEHLNVIAELKDNSDYHNVQFVNFKTDKGTFQFTVYNCHNGYYGHDVTLIYDDYETLYCNKI